MDLIGKKFGRLTAIKDVGKNKRRHRLWECTCICGNIVNVASTSLIEGRTKSCGCLIKEGHACTTRLPKGEASFNHFYMHYIRGAKRRGHKFGLSKARFRELTSQNCCYCGAEPKAGYKILQVNGMYLRNGIDRVDNSKGYVESNCVPCCFSCNTWKRADTQEEFLERITKIYENCIKRACSKMDIFGELFDRVIQPNAAFRRAAIKECMIESCLKGVHRNTPILKAVSDVRGLSWGAWVVALCECVDNPEFINKVQQLYLSRYNETCDGPGMKADDEDKKPDGFKEISKKAELLAKAAKKKEKKQKKSVDEDESVKEGNLEDHARRELQIAGLFNKDSDYDGMLGEAVMELMEIFGEQGHSGFSAACTLELFKKLASFENLTELTDNPNEWMQVNEHDDEKPDSKPSCWQSCRRSDAFSEDGGKTYYTLADESLHYEDDDGSWFYKPDNWHEEVEWISSKHVEIADNKNED